MPRRQTAAASLRRPCESQRGRDAAPRFRPRSASRALGCAHGPTRRRSADVRGALQQCVLAVAAHEVVAQEHAAVLVGVPCPWSWSQRCRRCRWIALASPKRRCPPCCQRLPRRDGSDGGRHSAHRAFPGNASSAASSVPGGCSPWQRSSDRVLPWTRAGLGGAAASAAAQSTAQSAAAQGRRRSSTGA